MSKNLKREISTAMLRKAIFIATGIKLYRVFYSYRLSFTLVNCSFKSIFVSRNCQQSTIRVKAYGQSCCDYRLDNIALHMSEITLCYKN